MNDELVLSIAAEAIKTTMLLSAPLLLTAMIIGIVVSVLQAITQINESTLTFIPKVVAIVLILGLFGPWMLEVMKSYTTDIIVSAGEIEK